MASVVVTPTALRNLASLIEILSLPSSTTYRVRRALDPLGEFPRLGAPLEGRWSGLRFILGPWRWMILVYRYAEATDEAAVVTIQDSRSARSASASR